MLKKRVLFTKVTTAILNFEFCCRYLSFHQHSQGYIKPNIMLNILTIK